MIKINWIITLFTLVLICLYLNYYDIKYQEVDLRFPNNYKTKHIVCDDACNVINHFHCKEWVSLFEDNLCQFVCDAHLDYDSDNYSSEWNNIFKCATKAKSSSELERCKISCSIMDEI